MSEKDVQEAIDVYLQCNNANALDKPRKKEINEKKKESTGIIIEFMKLKRLRCLQAKGKFLVLNIKPKLLPWNEQLLKFLYLEFTTRTKVSTNPEEASLQFANWSINRRKQVSTELSETLSVKDSKPAEMEMQERFASA